MAPSATPEKRRRLSNLFGKRRSSNDLGNTNDTRPSNDVNTLNGDSAYASSDTSRTSPDQRTVPLENNGQISGVARDRNLALDKSTNQVVDADTGETVVTTVTTTTTTTTVTKGRNGEKDTSVQVESRPGELGVSGQQGPGTLQVAEAPGDSPATHRRQPSADRQQLRPEDARAPIRTMADGQPSVPGRDRSISGEHDPVSPASPTTHNFSYPSRSDLRGTADANDVNGYQEYQQTPEQQHRGSSALSNLKAAAIGLHGVGETLRSTLNSEVDNRLSRKDPAKQQAAEEKNRRDMERGQREMARLREARGLQPTILATSKSQEAGYRVEPDSTTHPAYRQQQSSLYPPDPQQGRSPQPVTLPQQPPTHQPTGFNKQEADRYQASKSPLGRFRSASQQAREGSGGPVGGTAATPSGHPASNVQAISYVQNNGQEPEAEKKGLRALFKKGKAAI